MAKIKYTGKVKEKVKTSSGGAKGSKAKELSEGDMQKVMFTLLLLIIPYSITVCHVLEHEQMNQAWNAACAEKRTYMNMEPLVAGNFVRVPQARDWTELLRIYVIQGMATQILIFLTVEIFESKK
jgi:hypothetical protein